VLAAALFAASASAAIPVNPGGPDMLVTTATLSSTKAAAKPVALTLKLHYEMQCGQPGIGKAVVALPEAVTVPARIDESAVLVNGKPAPLVSVSGHDVSIGMPARRSGVTCMIVGPGTLTLTLTRAAGLGNPKSAGTYTVHVHRNTQRSTQPFQASFQISA
jgi:hypothetical protein